MKKFRNMTLVEKAEYLNEKFFEIGGKLYHRKLNHRNKGYGPVGCTDGKGYLTVKIEGHMELIHRIIYAMHHDYMPENFLDHINRDRKDNRISNLREVSNRCNLRNAKQRVTNSSGIQGVVWYTRDRKWQAQIVVNSKHKYLGLYEDFADAVCARLAAEQCLSWEGCDSSSSAYRYVQTNIIKK